ncbi:trypsin-1-like isoform X2 [Thrips palmi]|uniref:Trypsin-1-like isoform X2 n=1 Tax=Thrips palmi TaxID=161013 RepID=A0A6P8XTW7_THRPL|nr:trypsin-1-like isoform X2 [Thrips palmi]
MTRESLWPIAISVSYSDSSTVVRGGSQWNPSATTMASLLFALLVVSAALQVWASPPPSGAGLFIVDGNTALQGQFPYQVSVRRLEWGSWRHRCGGSIVTADWVLTAASCVEGAWFLRVAAGKSNLRITEDGEQVVKISKTVVHPDFKKLESRTWENDVAMLRTKTPFTFSDYVRPARLPLTEYTTEGGALIVTGWGVSSPGGWFNWGRRKPDALQVTVVQTTRCPAPPVRHGQSQPQPQPPQPRALCVAPGSTPCEGDEGGALVEMLADNTFTVVAMVTRTPKNCKKPKEPSAAVSVFDLQTFIQDTMASY